MPRSSKLGRAACSLRSTSDDLLLGFIRQQQLVADLGRRVGCLGHLADDEVARRLARHRTAWPRRRPKPRRGLGEPGRRRPGGWRPDLAHRS